MASEGFKSNYVHRLTGLLVLLAVVLGVTAVVIIGNAKKWFMAQRSLTVIFPEEGTFGLSAGAEIQVLGIIVGKVDDIEVDDQGRVRAHTHIREDFFRLIRKDSRALIKKRFGVAGDAYLEITKGTEAGLPTSGGQIQAEPFEELSGMIGQLIDDVRKETVPTIQKLRDAATELELLAKDLRNEDGGVQKLLATTNSIAERIDRGEGTLGRLMTDEKLATRLDSIFAKADASLDSLGASLDNLQKSTQPLPGIAKKLDAQVDNLPGLVTKTEQLLGNMDAVAVDLRKATAEMPRITKALADEAEAMPGLVIQLQSTLREMEIFTKGLQSNWLLGSGDVEPNSPRLSPFNLNNLGPADPVERE